MDCCPDHVGHCRGFLMSCYQEFNNVVAVVFPNLNLLAANTKKVVSTGTGFGNRSTPSCSATTSLDSSVAGIPRLCYLEVCHQIIRAINTSSTCWWISMLAVILSMPESYKCSTAWCILSNNCL